MRKDTIKGPTSDDGSLKNDGGMPQGRAQHLELELPRSC